MFTSVLVSNTPRVPTSRSPPTDDAIMAACMSSFALPGIGLRAPTPGARRPTACTSGAPRALRRATLQKSLLLMTTTPRAVTRRGLAVVVRASASGDAPEEARDSIELGLSIYKKGDYDAALVEFERALTLPGSGTKQFKDKPAQLSNGEKVSALYNISCCHARLDSEYFALLAFAGALEAGFRDWTTFFADPEMELVRAAQKTPGLLAMFDKDQGENLMRIQKGETVIEERKGLEAFVKGDWLWKALTKTRPPTDEEYAELVGDGKNSFENRGARKEKE